MSYHDLFDTLGRPLPRRQHQRLSALHKLIRIVSGAVIVMCLAILVWGR